MTTPLRRQNPRYTLPIAAYVEIEPGIGAIVLNVSTDGLFFQSVAPIEPGGAVNFALKENDRRMTGRGEVVWIDERKRSGGLRFIDLSSEAREQVSAWIKESPDASVAEPGSMADEQAVPEDVGAMTPAPAPATLRVPVSRFSVGFLAGLLTAVLATAVVLMGYTHRSDVGQYLISLGERLAGHSDTQTPIVVQQPPEVVPTTQAPEGSRGQVAAPEEAAGSTVAKAVQTEVPSQERLNAGDSAATQAEYSATADTTKRMTPVPREPARATSRRADTVREEQLAILGPPPEFLHVPPAPFPKLTMDKSEAASQPVTTSAPSLRMANSTLQMFFEVGKFKEEASAKELSDRVARLGLRTSVLRKRSLWKTSYQVLVGPYSDEDEEVRIEAELFSHGYKPRPFERGSRNFMFISGLNLNGARLPVGDQFTISWESYVGKANVQFARNGVFATASGKWIQRPQKYAKDEYVYIKEGPNKTLVEIHFAGLKRALVFRDSS